MPPWHGRGRRGLGADRRRGGRSTRSSLLAPVPAPPKVLGIGMNYRAHVAEMGRQPPEYQYWFNKQRTCVVGPGHPIDVPAVSEQVDYEGELGIVIGRRAKSVPADRWLEVVAGFTVVNDVSVRDWQARTPTFTMGKSFDTHGPTGPFIVTPDEVGDPGALALRTWVNGELRQDSTTADLIFTCGEMIEYLTTVFPLEPGDVVATGTPAGVGMGFDPPRVAPTRRRRAHRDRRTGRAREPSGAPRGIRGRDDELPVAVGELELDVVGVAEHQHRAELGADDGECSTRWSASRRCHSSSSTRLATSKDTWSSPVRVSSKRAVPEPWWCRRLSTSDEPGSRNRTASECGRCSWWTRSKPKSSQYHASLTLRFRTVRVRWAAPVSAGMGPNVGGRGETRGTVGRLNRAGPGRRGTAAAPARQNGVVGHDYSGLP